MQREDLNSLILEEIAAAAQCHDVAPEQAQAIAETIEQRLRQRIGGCERRYLRKLDNAARDAAIRREFTGHNLSELSVRYHLTERRIRQIVGPD